MKKVVKFTLLPILIFALLFAFTACNKTSDEGALSVGDANVPSDIFAYYLDDAMQFKGDGYKKDDALADAETLCARYVKINTEFEKRELTLTSNEKANVADEVNNIWTLFGGYYEKIGVSKETLTKVKTSEAYGKKISDAVFGQGGENEKSLADQKQHFKENYIFFKVINAYLTGDTAEDDVTKATFENMKVKITGTVTIDTVNAEYMKSIGETPDDALEVSMMYKGSDLYPQIFWDTVYVMDNGAVQIITTDDYIFLVQKVDGSDQFATYQSAVLQSMIGNDFNTYIDGLYKDSKIIPDKSTEGSIYSLITKTKEK